MLTITRHSALVLGFLFLGCTRVTLRENADHCTHNEGDRYCAELFPERPYCIQGKGECSIGDRYGCVDEVTPECHAPCGELAEDECVAGSSTSTDTSSGSESSSGSSDGGESSSSTTGPTPCVSDEECTDADAPFCGATGECGTCDGAEDPDGVCAGVDPLLPLCVGGACVACMPENPVVCEEQLLLCDGGTNACVPCTEHEQCGSGACELAVGTCFPPDVVVHVDGDPGAMPVPDFTSVSAAVASIGDGTYGVIVVHELDGDAPYLGTVTIDGDKTIALLAAADEHPLLQGTGAGNPGLQVEGAGTLLYIDGLAVAGNTMGLGLRVNDALAWVDRSRIVQNSGGGVLAENGAELVLRNCFVGGAEDVDALSVDAATLDVLYTTVGGGNGAFGEARALSCTAAVDVEVRNSILMAVDDVPELACVEAQVSNTATETAVAGVGNQSLGPVQATWFTNYTQGDFTLASPPAVISTTAVWEMGDPLTDLDGDPRPVIDGTPDYAGADVP